MLKDITLCQYFPGNSFIHRLDAMIKLILSAVYLVIIFLIKNFYGYGLLAAFTLFTIIISTVPLKFVLNGIKPLLWFIIFTAILNLFMTGGTICNLVLKLTKEGIFCRIYDTQLFFLYWGHRF